MRKYLSANDISKKEKRKKKKKKLISVPTI